MTAPKKKSQHYVPRFLLRNFSEDEKSICTYVLSQSRCHRQASIAGQCANDYFYGKDPGLENAFSEQEWNVAGILRELTVDNVDKLSTFGEYKINHYPSLKTLESLKHHPLYKIREFIHYQQYRTAASVAKYEITFNTMAKRILAEDHHTQLYDAEIINNLHRITIRPTNSIFKILYVIFPELVILLDLAVKFLFTKNPGSQLIIADHPVALQNNYAFSIIQGSKGIGHALRGFQMLMPVSPTMAVAVYDPAVYELGSADRLFAYLSNRDVHLLNNLQAMNALECVYFHPSAKLDLQNISKTWRTRSDRASKITVDNFEGGRRIAIQPNALPNHSLSCSRIVETFHESVSMKTPGYESFPVRSPELIRFSSDLRRYGDRLAKQKIVEGGLQVHPDWQSWFDSIE